MFPFYGAGEAVDKLYTSLKSAAARCDFHDVSCEVKDQIIMNCSSNNLRKKALRDDLEDLDLEDFDDLLKCTRSYENSDRQAALMEGASEVRRIRRDCRNKQTDTKSVPVQSAYFDRQSVITTKVNPESSGKCCYSCGDAWPHLNGKQSCPAYGNICKCVKPNHFGKVCKSKTVVNNRFDESLNEVDNAGLPISVLT